MENDETSEPIELEDPGPRYEAAIAKLKNKRRRFVEEYLIDLNGTRAAIRAGYAESGAHTEGWRLLRNADVAEAVKWGLAMIAERSHLSQAWIREGLKQNVRRAWDKGDIQAANRALQILGLSLGMFQDDVNVNVNATESAKVVMYFPDNGRGPKPKGQTNDGNDEPEPDTGTERDWDS